MKKVLLITALSLCVSSAFAAETATLKVQGTLTNAACLPSLSNGGVVDFGKLKLGNLSATETNQLGNKEINLTITCDAATKVSWSTVDGRSDSRASLGVENGTDTGDTVSNSTYQFGLGKTAGGISIGAYVGAVKAGSVVADGKSVDLIYHQSDNPDSNLWVSLTTGLLQQANLRNISVASSGSLVPLAFTTATFPIKIAAAIQDTTKLAITDDTQLDGQVTISLSYL